MKSTKIEQPTKSYPDQCLERAEKATEGPWSKEAIYDALRYAHKHLDDVIDLHSLKDNEALPASQSSEFIAHARQDVPTLANMVKELEHKNGVLESKLKRAIAYIRQLTGNDPYTDELEAMPERE